MDENTKDKIIAALTQYDEKAHKAYLKNPRRYHNPYALGIYLEAVDHIEACVVKGHDLQEAIEDAFSGPLRKAVLKAVGLTDSKTNDSKWCRELLQDE